MNINTFDLTNPYVYLKLDDGSEIHVKLDDEGVVVDRWVDDEVVESTCKTYDDMKDEEEADDDHLFSISAKHPIMGEIVTSNHNKKRVREVTDNMKVTGYTNIEVITMTVFNKK